MAGNSFFQSGRYGRDRNPVGGEVRVMHLKKTAHFAGEAFGWHEDAAHVPLDEDVRNLAIGRVWLYGAACLALLVLLTANGIAG